MLQYLHMCSLEENPPVFKTVVTDVRHFGLFVEAIDIMTKGLIKIEDFPVGSSRRGDRFEDQWRFEANLLRFTGPNDHSYQIGQQYDCVVANVDMERQMVDFKFLDS